jgi:hypothetical protein
MAKLASFRELLKRKLKQATIELQRRLHRYINAFCGRLNCEL